MHEDTLQPSDIHIIESLGKITYIDYDHYRERIHAIRLLKTFGFRDSNYRGEWDVGFLLHDLSGEHLLGEIVGPISEQGINEYIYRMSGETTIDGVKVYIITCAPLDENDPLVVGTLYIESEEYSLIRADVSVTDMGLLKVRNEPDQTVVALSISQSMKKVSENLWRPAFSEISETKRVSVLGMKVGDVFINMRGLFGDYLPVGNEDVLSVRRKVDDDAYIKDSLYWVKNSLLPEDTISSSIRNCSADTAARLSSHEIAQKRIPDSLHDTDITKALLIGDEVYFSSTILTTPGLLSIHYFDRVQGFNLWYPVHSENVFSLGDRTDIGIGYGFSDKRMKFSVGYKFFLPLFYSTTFGASIFRQLSSLEEKNDQWGSFMVTASSILTKYDYKDYYFNLGYHVSLQSDLSKILTIDLFQKYESHKNAVKTSDWSLLRSSWLYRQNKSINEGKIISFGFLLGVDGRDFVEEKGSFKQIGTSYPHRPRFGIEYSKISVDGFEWDATIYSLGVDGIFNLYSLGKLQYSITGFYSDNKLPMQKINTFPGTVYYLTANDRFRTLDYREFGRDRSFQLSVDYEFYRGLYSLLPLSALRNIDWTLNLFYNMGASELRDASKNLLHEELQAARVPFHEVGVRIGKVFSYFALDCAWRLNHFKEGRNFLFRFSLSNPRDRVVQMRALNNLKRFPIVGSSSRRLLQRLHAADECEKRKECEGSRFNPDNFHFTNADR